MNERGGEKKCFSVTMEEESKSVQMYTVTPQEDTGGGR